MEIGSEFELSTEFISKAQSTMFFEPANNAVGYFATGRAAIYAALQDIKKTHNVKKAYLPDYCCLSCVEPFLKSGIEVIYYQVDFSHDHISYNIDYSADFDIFYSLSYFGFEQSNQDKIVDKIKRSGKIVIEDLTHRLLTNKRSNADYYIASLRKWFALFSGAVLIKNGGFIKGGKIPLSDEYLALKESAMTKKKNYLTGLNTSKSLKDEFLDEFSKANKMLCTDFENRAIDKKSLELLKQTDINSIAKIRHSNAKIIYTAQNSKQRFMFTLKSGDVPLFVPIILNSNSERDALRGKLCAEGIFCPVHWPNQINSQNPIYQKVLSVVIDQRYTALDMQRIVKILEEE